MAFFRQLYAVLWKNIYIYTKRHYIMVFAQIIALVGMVIETRSKTLIPQLDSTETRKNPAFTLWKRAIPEQADSDCPFYRQSTITIVYLDNNTNTRNAFIDQLLEQMNQTMFECSSRYIDVAEAIPCKTIVMCTNLMKNSTGDVFLELHGDPLITRRWTLHKHWTQDQNVIFAKADAYEHKRDYQWVNTQEMEFFNSEIFRTIVLDAARKANTEFKFQVRYKTFLQRDKPILVFEGSIAMYYLIGAIVVVLPIISRIIDERATGVKELLNLMGMSDAAYFFANCVFPFACVTVYGIVLLNNNVMSVEILTFSIIYPIIILLIVITNFCLLSLILSLFFTTASSGVTAVLVIMFGGAFFSLNKLHMFTMWNPSNLIGTVAWQKILYSVISPFTGFFFAVSMLCMHDLYDGGFKLEMIFTRLFGLNDITLFELVGVMAAEIVVLLFLLFYLNKTLPWLSGTQNDWFFCLNPAYYLPAKEEAIEENAAPNENVEVAAVKETAVIIECTNISKKFGANNALSNITMSMYDKEVTVLLGQSGAGKTTLMNIITGIMTPTSGRVRICGRSIQENRSLENVVMSFCQQQSVYFPDLTVYEHLVFYSMMRNMPNQSLDQSAKKAAGEVKLTEKLNDFAENLSGGMKRRLCTAIAVIGDPKLIILDEPTTGLDAETRNQIWDMLQEMRKERCILLSTHDMEEADALGDRIAVISAGKLGCYGTPYFLKKKFGSGYHLRLLKQVETFQSSAVLSLIQRFVPAAKIQSEAEAECIIELGNIDTHATLPLFQYLEQHKNELHIVGIGVTVTTIEDVFVNFLEHAADGDPEQKRDLEQLKVKKTRVLDLMADRKPRTFQSIFALMRKRVAYFLGWHWWTFGFCLFLYTGYFYLNRPIIVEMQKKSLSDLSRAVPKVEFEDMERHAFSLKQDKFKNPTCYFKKSSSQLATTLLPLIESQCHKVITVAETEDIDRVNLETFKSVLYNSIYESIALGFEIQDVTITYNDAFAEMKMIGQTLFYSALFRHMTRENTALFDAGFRFFVTDEVIDQKDPFAELFKGTEMDEATKEFMQRFQEQFMVRMVITFTLPLPFAMAVAFFVLMPITETNTQSKSLQILTGVQEIIYYMGHFMFDIILFIPFIFVYALLHLQLVMDIVNTEVLFPFCIASAAYLWAILPMTYLVSHCATTEGIGFTLMLLLTFIVHVIFSIVSFVKTLGTSGLNAFELNAGPVSIDQYVMPSSSYWKAVYRSYDILFYNEVCLTASKPLRMMLCSPSPPLLRPSCCNGSVETLSPYLDSAYLTSVGLLALLGFVYFCLLIVLEKGIIAQLMEPAKPALPNEVLDNDVVKEQATAANIIAKKEFNTVAMVVSDLRKFFKPSTLAVAGLSFTVRPKECFGLLGVNGAGKTTAFQMLTGFMPLTSGEAYISNDALHQNVKLFQRHIGYCPQYNGLLLRLTVWQMFQLFGALRGVKSSNLTAIIEDLGDILELREHLNKYCEDLSGGNKRKLSIGLAIIGQPEILFLDEPTAGVDIVAKKRILEFIDFAQENANMSVVLTSHALGECESVCDRVAIMVKGQFRCIGSLQQIKNKFGTGYTFNIKVTADQRNDEQFANTLIDAVQKAFGGVTLRSKHLGIFLFHIDHSTRRSWSNLFSIALNLQKTLGFEDFFLMDTTLQEIFCEFAKGAAIAAKPTSGTSSSTKPTTASSGSVKASSAPPVAIKNA